MHKLRWDREGVASTVGTIMALLVFLTFLSLIVNQYIPVFMKEEEAAHLNTAFGQFGQFKSDVDSQVQAAELLLFLNEPFAPVVTFSPITLGVDGVPVFAGPTAGELEADEQAGPWTLEFTYLLNDNRTPVAESSRGRVTLFTGNRYFIPQTIAYENGGVVKSQVDGETVGVEPRFAITVELDRVNVDLSLLTFNGGGGTVGTRTEGIRSKVLSVDVQTYGEPDQNVTCSGGPCSSTNQEALYLNETTRYGRAWFAFFNKTLGLAFGVLPSDFGTPGYTYTRVVSGSEILSEFVDTPFYHLERVKQPGTEFHDVRLILLSDNDPGTDTLPIGTVTVRTAQVEFSAGERGGEINI